jgi:hypothetical protein
MSPVSPFWPWNPFAPVDWLVNQIYWLTNELFILPGLSFVWLLSCLPPRTGYFGYIIFALWLTGWVSRHVPMIPLNPRHPMFDQPEGDRLWVALCMFDLLLAAGGAEIGFYIPNELADTIYRIPFEPGADTLGPIGRIAEVVGLVCGFRIALHCRYQLSLLMVIGGLGYLGLSIAGWVLGG